VGTGVKFLHHNIPRPGLRLAAYTPAFTRHTPQACNAVKLPLPGRALRYGVIMRRTARDRTATSIRTFLTTANFTANGAETSRVSWRIPSPLWFSGMRFFMASLFTCVAYCANAIPLLRLVFLLVFHYGGRAAASQFGRWYRAYAGCRACRRRAAFCYAEPTTGAEQPLRVTGAAVNSCSDRR